MIMLDPLASLALEKSRCTDLAFEEAGLRLQEQVDAEAETFSMALSSEFLRSMGTLRTNFP